MSRKRHRYSHGAGIQILTNMGMVRDELTIAEFEWFEHQVEQTVALVIANVYAAIHFDVWIGDSTLVQIIIYFSPASTFSGSTRDFGRLTSSGLLLLGTGNNLVKYFEYPSNTQSHCFLQTNNPC